MRRAGAGYSVVCVCKRLRQECVQKGHSGCSSERGCEDLGQRVKGAEAVKGAESGLEGQVRGAQAQRLTCAFTHQVNSKPVSSVPSSRIKEEAECEGDGQPTRTHIRRTV